MSPCAHYPFLFVYSHPLTSDTASQVKQLLDLLVAVVGPRNRVAYGAGVAVDFIIVAALEGLVTEEVDGLVLDAALFGFVLEVVEAVSLVPAGGEDIEGDLSANGEAVPERVVLAYCALRIYGGKRT